MDQKADGMLRVLLQAAALGRFPPPDGGVTVLPQPSPRDSGVIAFTAHSVVFTDAEPGWVREHLPPGDLSAPLCPPFLTVLSEHAGRPVNSVDMLLIAPPLSRAAGAGAPTGPDGLQRSHGLADPEGLVYPKNVVDPDSRTPAEGVAPRAPEVDALPGATVVARPGSPPLLLDRLDDRDHPRVARALHHRDHVSVWAVPDGVLVIGRGVAGRWEVSVEIDEPARGSGLGRRLAAAARHLLPGEPLWAQIAPGNAASVRAFLAAGYVPVGAEALLVPPGGG